MRMETYDQHGLMEMECIFFGESEKAYFNYKDLHKSREIMKPALPITDLEYIEYKGDRKKHKFYKPKKKNELRVLCVDTAIMGGSQNDASIFTYIRCVPSGNEYVEFVEYIEAMEGQHSAVQALRMKQLFYDFECDYCAMDTQGNSISIYEEATKITVDTARGIEYPAWCAMNDDRMQERAFDKDAVPVIYSIKAAGISGTEINHQMATYTKSQFEKGKIKLLCSEIEGRDYILDNEKSLKLTEEEKRRMISVYFQTTRLIYEMINLEMSVKGGFIKLIEPAGHRKDRYCSLAYGLYFIRGLEIEMRVSQEEVDEFDLLSMYSVL